VGLIDEKESLKAISVEELKEQAEEEDYLTPREFAKLMGVFPQQVYTWIRKGVFQAEKCKCGRTVVCVSAAQAAINKKARELGKFVDPKDDPRYQPDPEEVNQPYRGLE
jgi:hypothetical protein